jgi:hypothetical protein
MATFKAKECSVLSRLAVLGYTVTRAGADVEPAVRDTTHKLWELVL